MSRVAYHNFFDSHVAHKNKNTRVSRVAYRNVSKIKRKKFKKKKFFIGRTDGRTDTRTTQNYSSEPHKIEPNSGS